MMCSNIVGAVVGALYSPAANACARAQTYSTGGFAGLVIGGVMIALGIALAILSVGGKKEQEQGQKQPPQTTIEQFTSHDTPIGTSCYTCGGEIKW
jgi:hypothetical protein